MILDNARWHHANYLKDWLKANKNNIELVFLPPYAPHLNPIERVWKLTRYECTHNQYFENLQDLKKTVQRKFRSWGKPNRSLRKLCAII